MISPWLRGHIAPLAVITAGYALFQAANNTAVMTQSRADQRGVISGLLNLSRNLGLITGTSVMGAVFALGSATTDMMTARPEAVAAGMRLTFAVAAVLIVVALAIASSMMVGGHLVDLSPLSTIGALCIAALPDTDDPRRLFNQLLAWGLSMTVIGALICWILF